MKSLTFTRWRKALARASQAALLGLLGAIAALPARADPCNPTDYCYIYNNGGTYHVSFNITSTTPVAITDIMDFWGWRNVSDGQGDFKLSSLPSLPTGSGTLDAGFWIGEDAHFLMGRSGAGVVMIVNPATAAQMAGHSLDEMVNGIPPLAVPNSYPVSNVEDFFIDLMTHRPVEWEYDIWSVFFTTYHPNALDPTILIGPGSTTGVLMSFTTGKILGSVDIQLTPIPEPQSWALMLVGTLGLMGWLRRPGR